MVQLLWHVVTMIPGHGLYIYNIQPSIHEHNIKLQDNKDNRQLGLLHLFITEKIIQMYKV